MINSLYSDSWYRVADLRPRLRSHAQIYRHVYRGEVWYVLQDHASGRFHRFTSVANFLINLMDGTCTLQEIWEIALARLGSDVPPQEEIIKLLADLHRADVLQSDAAPDLEEQHHRRRVHWHMKIKQYFGNPLSLRFALFDPDKLLNRITPAFRWVTTPVGMLVWLAVVAYGIFLGASHWTELSTGAIDRLFIFHNLMLMWLLIPVIKILHEFGHALVTKLGGGEVHEMGIMLLVLMPIPYVDASAASAFRSKNMRMLTGAAGILVELFIAAVALIAWVHLDPGLSRAIAYNIVLITGVSTVILNGNPLLRYDGYYILADYLEIPNLAQRSSQYVGYLVNHYVFGVAGSEPPHMARGERGWFVFYVLASFVYKMFVTVMIVLMIAGRFFIIGILLAIWSLYSMMVMPATIKLGQMINSPSLRAKRWRAMGTSAGLAFSVVMVVGVLPLPSSTNVQGVTWVPDNAQVRAPDDCLIKRVVAVPMTQVHRSDLLVECENKNLLEGVRYAQAQLEELQARYTLAQTENRAQAQVFQQQMVNAQEALEVSQQRLSALNVKSPVDGMFIIDLPEDAPGKFVQRGDLIAYVRDRSATSVRVVVPQDDEDRVHERTTRVEIRPIDSMSDVINARIVREIPAATDELPSMSLSLEGGGNIGLDPGSPGNNHAIDRLFVVDLALPSNTYLPYLGSRIYVRFVHSPEPLAARWYRELRRLLIRRFNV